MTEIIESIEKQVKETAENDEEERQEESFIDEESTTQDEIENFEKWAKGQAQKSLKKYKDLTSLMQIEELRNLVIKLNTQQRIIFDDFCERLNENDGPPFYLYIAGEAGTGKSFLVKVMIEAVKHLKLVPGMDLRKPPVLVMAPTANAAYIINGKTIESSLGMLPNKKNTYAKRKNNQVSNLAFLYEDVAALFCDEISMVGSSKFTKMNFQMQDITGCNDFMGGLPFVAVGDFRQLPPVRDQFIYEKNHLDGRPSMAPSHWDDHFRIYYLTDKMRNQEDAHFAKICDRIGSGTYTPNDLHYLKNCVRDTTSENDNENFREGKVSNIVMTNRVRQEINDYKLDTLLPQTKSFTSIAQDRSTNLENPPEVPHNLSLTQTGGLETRLTIKKDSPVVITSNHPKARYKEDGFVNGAKGYVESVQVSTKDPVKVEVIWVVFKDVNICKILRYDLRNLLKLHKPCNERAVPILRQKKNFVINNGEVRYQRSQFPLTLSYASTAHKCQGDTLEEVIIDFDHTPADIKSVPCGSFYVALTRVKDGNSVYLKSFEEKYITFNKRVEEKIKAMRIQKPYIFKKIYIFDQIFEDPTDDLKFGYLNINGLMKSNHAEYMDSDLNLLHLDCLVLTETWLNSEITNEDLRKKFNNWNVLKRMDASDNRKHMGLLFMVPTKSANVNKFLYNLEYFEGCNSNARTLLYQGLVLDIKSLYRRAVFLYIRETPSFDEIHKLRQSFKNADCLIGDLNLNPKIPDQQRKLMAMCGETMYMALDEITTINGTQLDHVIIEKDLKTLSYAAAYFNFASDHKAITIRIASSENSFTVDFKEKINFDQDFHTKKKKGGKMDEIIESKESDELNDAFILEEEGSVQDFQSSKSPKDSLYSTKILLFMNPIRNNLCFSNSVASLLLNIPKFQTFLSTKNEEMRLYSEKNEIVRELVNLSDHPNFSETSTHHLRSIVHTYCTSCGQSTRTFSDKNQHDASEFLISLLEHMFKDLPISNNFDEKLFGGLYQELLVCKNGHIRQLQIQNLPNMLMIPIIGNTIQTCLDNYLADEEVMSKCSDCDIEELVKQTEIITEPSTIIIQLKRYSYDEGKRMAVKKNDSIEITRSLNMASGTSYTISSIINHFGDNPKEGHYNVLIYDCRKDLFVLLDDQYVNQNVKITTDFKSSSYVFVYTKDN